MSTSRCDSNNTSNVLDTIKLQFEKFLSLINTVLNNDKEVKAIQNNLRRRFNVASSSYLSSNAFHSLLNLTHSAFIENDKSSKYFKLLSDLDEQLKTHTIESTRSNRSSTEVNVTTTTTTVKSIKIVPISTEQTIAENSISTSTIQLSVSLREENNRSESNVEDLLNSSAATSSTHITTDVSCSSDNESKTQRRIQKLERRLSRLANIIRELEEKDMSLEEMEYCDLYIVESKLKKQACEVYEKLTELKKQSSSTQRILHRPVVLPELGHSSIKKALEDLINGPKFFPSFSDVLNAIEKVDEEHHLRMGVEAQKKLAEKYFKIIGKEMKDRRMSDFHDIMKSRLPEDFDVEQTDPALHNSEMQKELTENEQQARIKTEKIFEEFSQVDPETQEEIDIESSDELVNETEEDAEEEEEEEEAVSENEDENRLELDQKQERDQFDVVDMLPPFASQPTSPTPVIIVDSIESLLNEDDILNPTVLTTETKSSLIIRSTMTLPLKRERNSGSRSNSDVFDDEISIADDGERPSNVTTLIPRRRVESPAKNKKIYNLYQQRLTNHFQPSGQKRSLPAQATCSTTKKQHQQPPDLVVLD